MPTTRPSPQDPLASARLAIASGSAIELASALAEHNALPQTRPRDLFALWHAVIDSGSPALALSLIEAGVPVDSAPPGHRPPLDLALERGAAGVAEALLNAGADPDRRDERGDCHLLACLRRGQTALASLLLRFGANPNATDDSGFSALHQACFRGLDECAAALLVRGADPLALDPEGATPEQSARASDKIACAEVLAAFIEARALSNAMPRPVARPGPAL